MDKEMVEVINKEMDKACYDRIGDRIAQRLHDAGYRKVPSVYDIHEAIPVLTVITDGIHGDLNDNKAIISQAIHDLIMGGK